MTRRKNSNVDNRAYKFRLYPNAQQTVLINKTFGCVRFVYNALLSDKTEHYKKHGTQLKKEVSEYKKDNAFLKEVDSLALANAKLNLETAYRNFFDKRAKYPTFHKKGRNDSYTTNNVNGNIEIVSSVKPNGAEAPFGVKLPKLGVVKAKLHRNLGKDEKIKSCTISRTAGKYYISIITELEKQEVVSVNPQQVADDRILGIDFSVPSFYVDSNGNSASYPHAYRRIEKKLIKEQKKLSRKVYGSHNYYKQLLKVQRLHQRVSNIRKDFLHKLSRELVSNYDIICFEDINLSNMKRCLRFGKSISDEGFGAFRTYVAYKALRLGKHVIKVDKWYASTKTCNHCGHKNDSLTLKDREWECPRCGHHHNRDHNAAMNIKNESVRILLSA